MQVLFDHLHTHTPPCEWVIKIFASRSNVKQFGIKPILLATKFACAQLRQLIDFCINKLLINCQQMSESCTFEVEQSTAILRILDAYIKLIYVCISVCMRMLTGICSGLPLLVGPKILCGCFRWVFADRLMSATPATLSSFKAQGEYDARHEMK